MIHELLGEVYFGHAKTDYRTSQDGALFLQALVENVLIKIFQGANLCALHAKRETVQPRDIQLARRLAGLNIGEAARS